MLQAQASGADVIALNNAGGDTINAVQTAGEFGITQAGQILAGMVLFSTDIRSIGLENAQGLQFTKAWYYDLNDETRAWAERFRERTGSMPTMVHAGLYSSTRHYLEAIKATGTDDTQTVRQQMGDTPLTIFSRLAATFVKMGAWSTICISWKLKRLKSRKMKMTSSTLSAPFLRKKPSARFQKVFAHLSPVKSLSIHYNKLKELACLIRLLSSKTVSGLL